MTSIRRLPAWHMHAIAFLAFTSVCTALLNAHWGNGVWQSHHVCHNYQTLPGNLSTGASETCSFAIVHIDSVDLVARALTCGGLPAMHGKDFTFAELFQDGVVRTRLLGHHIGDGVYRYEGWRQVSSGVWDVVLRLGATPSSRLFGVNESVNTLLMGYLWETWSYMQYPNTATAKVTFAKHDRGFDGRGSAVVLPQCTSPGKGEWKYVDVRSTECPPDICVGPLAPLELNSTDNAERLKMSHVYTPYTCRYRIYDDLGCLRGKRVLLNGHSRTRQVADFLRHLAGNRSDLIHNVTMCIRRGLECNMEQENITAQLEIYDYVVYSSLLHDLADFVQPADVEWGMKRGFVFDHLPGYAKEHACAPGKPGHAKYQPVKRYLQALDMFIHKVMEAYTSILRANKKPPAKMYWLLHGSRLGLPETKCLPNTADRILCVQALVLERLRPAIAAGYITPVDLATMEMDAPRHWWADAVHVAWSGSPHRKFDHSGLENMAVQVLLNTMCSGV